MTSGAALPPTLSVLVLNHNYARFLGTCLESILAQSFEGFELIVVDDASTDDSLKVASRFSDDPRLRIVPHEVNCGFVPSLVEGTERLSSGEFLMVISADDLVLARDAFAAQLAWLREDPGCVACITAYAKLGPGSARALRRLFNGDRFVPGLEFVRRQLTDREFNVLHSGTMIRADAYRRAGGYRRDLTNYLDLAMWLALGRLGPVAYIDRPLFGYRVHAAQLSGSRTRHREVLREGLNLLASETRAARASGLDLSPSAVLRARIADLALSDAFAGRRFRALQRCVDAVALAPLAAVTASGWWLALARAVAGARGWSLAAAARRRLP